MVLLVSFEMTHVFINSCLSLDSSASWSFLLSVGAGEATGPIVSRHPAGQLGVVCMARARFPKERLDRHRPLEDEAQNWPLIPATMY